MPRLRRHLRSALPTVVAAVALTTIASGGTAEAADGGRNSTWRIADDTSVRILGHGYGHGHGMSQYGAEGAARQGLSAPEILAFYYPGTKLATTGGTVRIWLTAVSPDSLEVRARDGLLVIDAGAPRGQRRTTLPSGADAPGRWRLRGRHLEAHDAGGWRRVRTLQGTGAFAAHGEPISVRTADGRAAYRGRLTTATTPGGQRVVINRVGMEDYLRGVVPREIPASWSPAAVRAQAIAARTYAAFERAPGNTTYDLCDTTSCQVYGGVAAEVDAADRAIEATAHRIVTDDGAPAFTQFGSSNGGWSSAGAQSYLAAVKDPYDGWSGNPVHDWRVATTGRAIEAAYPGIGDLRSVRVTGRDGNGQWGGRVTALTITGSQGSVRTSGDSFRLALGLRSTWFTLRTS